MRLHLTTMLFVILEQINKIFTQTMPISPCPKVFQYRFDGIEWFGVLSVRNPDFGQALHLKVTLSMRGKPTTNYLGEIELLTRGQFRSDMPVLYKVKFPKTHLPPRLLQIMANHQVICLGAADHSIFVTQIILEHTRKFTFISHGDSNGGGGGSDDAIPLSPDVPLSPVAGGGGDDGVAVKQIDSLPAATHAAAAAFDTKHFPFESTFDKKPMRSFHENCGKIDERIRFQLVQAISTRRRSATPHAERHESPAVAAAQMRSSVGGGGASSDDGPLITTDDDNESQTMPTELHGDAGSMSTTATTTTATTTTTPTTVGIEHELPSITRGAWPWLAAVYVNNLTSLAYQCGGTLISSRIVISSAHCFHMYQKRYTANEVLVFLGRHNLGNWNEEGSFAAPVDDIFIHPNYDSHLNTYDADIAVVLLKHDTRFNTFIRPACMWTGSTKLQYIDGELGIVVGWGLANLNAQNASAQPVRTNAVPRIVSASIVTNDVCFSANTQYQSLSSNRTFCAGTVTPMAAAATTTTKATRPHQRQRTTHKPQTSATSSAAASSELCTGDSGAGLMIYKNNRWTLRGIVSASLAQIDKSHSHSKSQKSINCNSNQYVIYTDVGKFLDWIYAFMI